LLIENIKIKVRAELERAGRDKMQVRNSLRWLLFSLEMSAGKDEFAEEYSRFLLASWTIALAELKDEAVAEEEYEWASELHLMLDEVQLIENEVY
jgi:hypothetical protein